MYLLINSLILTVLQYFVYARNRKCVCCNYGMGGVFTSVFVGYQIYKKSIRNLRLFLLQFFFYFLEMWWAREEEGYCGITWCTIVIMSKKEISNNVMFWHKIWFWGLFIFFGDYLYFLQTWWREEEGHCGITWCTIIPSLAKGTWETLIAKCSVS